MTPLLAAVVAALTGGDWVTDADGRSFRVGFDPGSRLVLGAGWDYDVEGEVSRLALETAWYIRADDADDGVIWKLSHTLGMARLGIGDDVRVEALAYRGEFLRWSKDGKITIPTSPPSRIGFPVDIGVSVELGRWRTRSERATYRDEVGVAATELLFDFWRSPVSGSYFLLGIGASYDVWLDPDAAARHVVAPFSRARLTLHHEWSQGRQLLEATVDGMTAWTSDETWAEHVGAALGWEWIFLALNDQPLSLRVTGQWRWDELLTDAGDGHELRATAGLRLGL